MTADTPNLEAITSDTALERWPVGSVERAIVLAARAELSSITSRIRSMEAALCGIVARFEEDGITDSNPGACRLQYSFCYQARAALRDSCASCDGTGQGDPSFDGEKYSPRDCVKCGGSDAV